MADERHADDEPGDGDHAGGHGAPAPKMLTTTQASRRINLTIVLMFVFAVPMIAISKATIMWIAVLVVWIILWIGFWTHWGRLWHPVRQFRYEWGGYRRGTFKRASVSERAYRQAWEETGGDPPKIPPTSDE